MDYKLIADYTYDWESLFSVEGKLLWVKVFKMYQKTELSNGIRIITEKLEHAIFSGEPDCRYGERL